MTDSRKVLRLSKWQNQIGCTEAVVFVLYLLFIWASMKWAV